MKKRMLGIFLTLSMVLSCLSFSASAASGTVYESESNDTYAFGTQTYNDYNSYGSIASTSDVDWWKISFDRTDTVRFYLGNIPSNCQYKISLYGSDGATRITSRSSDGASSVHFYYYVTAYQTYYLKIEYVSGTLSTTQYILNGKKFPTHHISTVPLYTQETDNTCGCASARMILANFGIYQAESDIKYTADSIAEDPANYTYVYAVSGAINYYMNTVSNLIVRYKYTDVSQYSLDDYQDLVAKNITLNCPVLPLLKVNNTTYFPYTTNGHYVVIKGITFDESTEYYTSVVNDPHNNYSGTYYVPLSSIYDYTKAHNSGGYVIYAYDY